MLGGTERDRSEALSALYDRYALGIYRYCRKILGSEDAARDALQETFLRFLRSTDVDRDYGNLAAYLLRIARNLCLNAKRLQRREHISLEEFHLPSSEQTLESEELTRLVVIALDKLPEDYREALILQMYNGLSYKQIAELIEVPLSTVRNRIVRAKLKIRKLLTPYLEDLQK